MERNQCKLIPKQVSLVGKPCVLILSSCENRARNAPSMLAGNAEFACEDDSWANSFTRAVCGRPLLWAPLDGRPQPERVLCPADISEVKEDAFRDGRLAELGANRESRVTIS